VTINGIAFFEAENTDKRSDDTMTKQQQMPASIQFDFLTSSWPLYKQTKSSHLLQINCPTKLSTQNYIPLQHNAWPEQLQLGFSAPETFGFGNSFRHTETVADIYYFGDTESIPENKNIGNGVWRTDTFCFWLPETVPETDSAVPKPFVSGTVLGAPILFLTLGFGNVIEVPETADFPE
jgi:hypothetical protein